MRLSYSVPLKTMVMFPFFPTHRNRYNRNLFYHEDLGKLDLAKSGPYEGQICSGFGEASPGIDDAFSLMCEAADAMGMQKPERIIHMLSPSTIESAIVEGTSTRIAAELLEKAGPGALWWVLLLDGTLEGSRVLYPRPGRGVPLMPEAAIAEFLMVLGAGMLVWADDTPPATDSQILDYLSLMRTPVVKDLSQDIFKYLSHWGYNKSLEFVARVKDAKTLGTDIRPDLQPNTNWEDLPRIGALYFLSGKLRLDQDRLHKSVLREIAIIRELAQDSSDESVCYRTASIITNPDLPANIDYLLGYYRNPTPDRNALRLTRAVLRGELEEHMLTDLPGARTRKYPGSNASRSDRVLLRLLHLQAVAQDTRDKLAVMLSGSTKLDYFLYLKKKMDLTKPVPQWRAIGFSLSRKAFETIMGRKTALAKLGLWFSRMAADVTIIDGQACVPAIVARRLSCTADTKVGLTYWITQLTKGQPQPQLKEGET